MVASVARWDEHARMLVIHKEKCKEPSQSVQHMNERQEMFSAMTERKRFC